MKKGFTDELHRINYLAAEIDSLYHISSLRMGVTDSVSIVLYTAYVEGGECMLKDIYKRSGINKQTVNSAVRGLEKRGILYLEQYNGRSKKVVLTDKGREYTKNTAERLFRAETDAFNTWTEEEINAYIKLMEKHTECFRKQVEKL